MENDMKNEVLPEPDQETMLETGNEAAEEKPAEEVKKETKKAKREAEKAERAKRLEEERQKKAEMKERQKAEREARKGQEQNGVRQPGAGTKTRLVWDTADKIGEEKGDIPTFKEIKERLGETFNETTIRVQLLAWKRFNGIVS